MKKLFLLCIFSIAISTSFSQTIYSTSDYTKKPIWINMMDDPHVNYWEAIKAYEAYWTSHTKPVGESDMDVKNVSKNKKRFSQREIREARAEAAMRMQVKKFEWWKTKMEPFVKEDGTIMTADERRKMN